MEYPQIRGWCYAKLHSLALDLKKQAHRQHKILILYDTQGGVNGWQQQVMRKR
jgi:hypothetical protein